MGQMIRRVFVGCYFYTSVSLSVCLIISFSFFLETISAIQGGIMTFQFTYFKIFRVKEDFTWCTVPSRSTENQRKARWVIWSRTPQEPNFFMVTTNVWTIKIWSATDCQQLQQVRFAIYECSSNRWMKDVQCTANLELLIIQQLLVWHWLQFSSLWNWAQMERQTCLLQQTLH